MSNIMQVFYGKDLLPYKDKERQVHYPIVGSAFLGASNTTQIRFYIKEIGSNTDTWVANSKLPNGKMGNKILSVAYDDEVEEYYALLNLSSFYTQAKGDLYISLNGFFGGVEITYNSETEQYEINGIPTIQATGVVKIAINYATPLMVGDEEDVITFQQLLAEISTKLPKNDNKYLKVVELISTINTPEYKDYLKSNDIVYSIVGKKFYILSGTYPSLVASEITLTLTNLKVSSFNNLIDNNDQTIVSLINDIAKTVAQRKYTMENSVVSLSDTDFEMLRDNDNMPIIYNDFVYFKTQKDSDEHIYECIFKSIEQSGEHTNEVVFEVVLDKTEQTLTYGTSVRSFYSQAQTDALLNLKADKSNTYTKAEIDTKLTSMLVYKGTQTVSQLNTLASTLGENNTGWFYNVSDSGVLTWVESGVTQELEVIAGDNVCWTGSGWDKLTMDLSAYDDKFISAGFFEVQEYNQSTGEITFVYASDLYDMSYNGNTGVLTIEAN